MAHTISRSPFFDNSGYRLMRTIARGEFVGGNKINLERVVQEGDLGSLSGRPLVDLVEGSLIHHGFVLAHHGTGNTTNDYEAVFNRGPDQMTLTLKQAGNGNEFSLVGTTSLNKWGTKTPQGVNFTESDLVGLLGEGFDDDDFFERFAGMPGRRSIHPGYHLFAKQAQDTLDTFKTRQPGSLGARSSDGTEMIYFEGEIKKVDLRGFEPIINGPNMRRQDGIASLAGMKNLEPFPYGRFTRYNHMVVAFYVMTQLCQRFGIEGEQRTKNLVNALTHDLGHTFFGHPGEDYFRYKSRPKGMRFDHEKASTWFTLRERRLFDQVLLGCADMQVELSNKRDPQHVLLDADLGGADRVGFTGSDPWQVGDAPKYRPTAIIGHMHLDEWGYWCDSPEEAFLSLEFHGQRYERDYYSPQKQIDDAYIKKVLCAAKFEDINDQVPVSHNGFVMMAPLWQLNDNELTFYLCNEHPDVKVRMMTRYWHLGGFGAPPATVAQLKIKGYERSEGLVQVPDFKRLTFSNKRQRVEGMGQGELDQYYKFWQDPSNQESLEKRAAKELGIPFEQVVIAGTPYKKRSANAPIRPNGRGPVVQLFDIEGGRYRKPFDERTDRMAGLRLAVHPRYWQQAHEALKKTPFSAIVRETYQESKNAD